VAKEDITPKEDDLEYEEPGLLDKLVDKFGNALVENPEGVAKFLREVFDGAADAWRKASEPRIKKEKSLTLAMYIFLGFLISVLAFLVYEDKMNGETMAFLVGSVIGYLFALMKQHLFPGL
jgi:hypothetical protein